jgi:hypothetical protein
MPIGLSIVGPHEIVNVTGLPAGPKSTNYPLSQVKDKVGEKQNPLLCMVENETRIHIPNTHTKRKRKQASK